MGAQIFQHMQHAKSFPSEKQNVYVIEETLLKQDATIFTIIWRKYQKEKEHIKNGHPGDGLTQCKEEPGCEPVTMKETKENGIGQTCTLACNSKLSIYFHMVEYNPCTS